MSRYQYDTPKRHQHPPAKTPNANTAKNKKQIKTPYTAKPLIIGFPFFHFAYQHKISFVNL